MRAQTERSSVFQRARAAGNGARPLSLQGFHVVSAACILSIAVYVTCVSFLLAEVAFNFVDIDIWHQMNLIRASLAAGHLLTQDPFSYVPTVRPMIQHEWGSERTALPE